MQTKWSDIDIRRAMAKVMQAPALFGFIEEQIHHHLNKTENKSSLSYWKVIAVF